MVVGNNKSTTTKNADELLAILIAIRCSGTTQGALPDGAHPGFTQSHWTLPSGECLRLIAPAAAMVDDFE